MALDLPMMPKMPKMFGAKITNMLMKVSRMRAMAMWRNQLKALVGNSICWMALRTCRHRRTVQQRCNNEIWFSTEIAGDKWVTDLQGTGQWGRSASPLWGRQLAHTGSKCHKGRSCCKCAEVQAPPYLQKCKEKNKNLDKISQCENLLGIMPPSIAHPFVTTRGSFDYVCWSKISSLLLKGNIP